MRQMMCEICGGTGLIKDGGAFVCQQCGAKYSVEEIKRMMSFDYAIAPVNSARQEQIATFLELSNSAYSSGNGQSALDYADKALEIDPKCYKAWISKMKAVEFLGTFGKHRLTEVVESGKNACLYAPKEEKEAVEYEVYKYQLVRALELLKLAMLKLQDDADIRRTHQTFMSISLFTATEHTMQADSGIVNLYDNVATEAVTLAQLIPDDVLGRHAELAELVGQCARQYQYETNALISRYSIYGASLLSSAVNARNANKVLLEEKSRKAYKKALEYEKAQKAAEREAYWAEHKEEKELLDKELMDLEIKKGILAENIEREEKRLNDPASKTAYRKLHDEVIDKRYELSKLGIFKAKEKKALQAELDELLLKEKDARKEYQDEEDKQMAILRPLYADRKSLEEKISAIKNKVNPE